MNRIVFPIGPDSQGPAPADLQAGWRFLVEDDFFGFNAQQRQKALVGLDEESLRRVRRDARRGRRKTDALFVRNRDLAQCDSLEA